MMLSNQTQIHSSPLFFPSSTRLDNHRPFNRITVNQAKLTRKTNTFRCLSLIHHYHHPETCNVSYPKKSITTTRLHKTPQKSKETRLYASQQPTNGINIEILEPHNTDFGKEIEHNNQIEVEFERSKGETSVAGNTDQLELEFEPKTEVEIKFELSRRDCLKRVYCIFGGELLLGALVYGVSKMYPTVAATILQNLGFYRGVSTFGSILMLATLSLKDMHFSRPYTFGLISVGAMVPLGAVLAALNGTMVAAGVFSTLAMVFALKWFTFLRSKNSKDTLYLQVRLFACLIVVQIAQHLQEKNPNPITFALNTGLGIPVFLGSTAFLLMRCKEDEHVQHAFKVHATISNLFFRIMQVLIVLYDYQNLEIIQVLQQLHRF